jgi:hypothetical protein
MTRHNCTAQRDATGKEGTENACLSSGAHGGQDCLGQDPPAGMTLQVCVCGGCKCLRLEMHSPGTKEMPRKQGQPQAHSGLG